MCHVIVCSVLFCAGWNQVSETSMERATLTVLHMMCASCAIRATEALEALGVSVLYVSVADDLIGVGFDTSEISLADMEYALNEVGLELQV